MENKNSNTGLEKTVYAECPLSWCDFAVAYDGDEAEHKSGMDIQQHVQEEHSAKDIETLYEQAE